MQNEKFYRNILENIYDGVYFVDTDRKITFWNKGAERITGYTASEVVGKYCHDNILNHINNEGVKLCTNGCPLEKTIIDGEMRDTNVFLHHKNGHRVPVAVKAIAITEGDSTIGAVEVFKDISEENGIARKMQELETLALRDQLTGLPNRRYIDSFMKSKVNEYLGLGIDFGVCFIDIDKFKNFNDRYGHDIGDEVLKMVSKTYEKVIRSNDMIGRWGGEEFIGVFTGVNEKSLENICEKLRFLVENSTIGHDREKLKVTISIGATLFSEGDSLDEVVKRADQLLYKSKNEGRNRVSLG